MNELDLVLARVNLNTTITKVKLSCDEIRKKNPQRSDLTNSMDKTIEELIFSICVYDTLEKEYRIARQINHDYSRRIFELENKVKELERQNVLLLQGI